MVKIKKQKIWLKIIAPKFLGGKDLGEIPANEPENCIGRRIILSAIDVLEDFNKYYLKFAFKVGKVEGGNAYLYFDGLECTRDYISRMVRRRVDRIDHVFDKTTKDGIKLRIKTIVVTRRIPRKIRTKIRKVIHELVSKNMENLTMEEFLLKVISGDLKKILEENIKKIYPPRFIEFRKIEIRTPLLEILRRESEKTQ
ncbi:MAG: 30S ribosomal protein S3ae [Candidatus Aenigmatarchaeota archaeon]